MRQKAKKFSPLYFLTSIAALLWCLVTLTPFFFMVSASLRSRADIYSHGLFARPNQWMIQNYFEVLNGHFLIYFRNSVFILVTSLFLILATASLAAYPLSRFKIPIAPKLLSLIIACMAIPLHSTLIPVFLLTQKIGLYGSLWALLGPYTAFHLPISIFMLSGFMHSLPQELEEAAEIDGCNKIRAFFNIILPLCAPGLATISIYCGVAIWNEFSFALVLTSSKESRTLPLSIWEYQGEYASNTPMIMTVLTLCTIPMLILFIFGQDKLIKGMVAGAIKG